MANHNHKCRNVKLSKNIIIIFRHESVADGSYTNRAADNGSEARFHDPAKEMRLRSTRSVCWGFLSER